MDADSDVASWCEGRQSITARNTKKYLILSSAIELKLFAVFLALLLATTSGCQRAFLFGLLYHLLCFDKYQVVGFLVAGHIYVCF